MPQPSIPAPLLTEFPGPVHRFPKAAAAAGLLAGMAAGAVLYAAAGHLQVLALDYAWRAAANETRAPLVFRSEQAPGPGLRTTAMLRGISGEVFASPGALAAASRAASRDAETAPLANVSPAAWDRLSAGDCITVTTQGGQALSFRIVGARPAGETKAETLPRIDLAVTACSGTGMGEPIAKAVIEPAAQRSL